MTALTFHILQIRVWVSTEGVSTEGVSTEGVSTEGVFVFFFSFYLSPGVLTIYTNHPGRNELCIHIKNYKI